MIGSSGSICPMSTGTGEGVPVFRLPAVGEGPGVGVVPVRGVTEGVTVPELPRVAVADAIPTGVAVLALMSLVGVDVGRESVTVVVAVTLGVMLGTAVPPGPG